MGIYGYTWEPQQVLTEDGWHLTMMKVTGKNTKNADDTWAWTPSSGENGGLLIQPPMGSTPDMWLSGYFFTNPLNNALLLKFVDDGFDVYFSYSRGTPPSSVNDYYTADQDEYWDFSWYDMGMYDTKAQVQSIYDQT
jgi:lysosomal acid lipase/cholesteryl ester hydrolase